MTIEELKKRLADVEAENAVLKSLNDQERAFHASLPEAERADFAKMDAEGRKAKMGDKLKKTLIGDEVEALEKRLAESDKAASEAKTEIAKRDEEIAKLKAKAEDAELRSEVEKRFPLSKGTTEEKMAVLKSVKAIADETVRKNILASMDQAETSLAELAKEKGASGGDNGGGDAKAQLDTLAKSIGEKDKTLTKEQAFAKACETPEGKKLYAQLSR